MGRKKAKANYRRIVLRLPDLDHSKVAVLNSLRFIGFLRIEFEGNAIYLHREDFDYGIAENGLWVDIPTDMTKPQQDEVNMRYAICVGVFTARGHGHMGMFSGEIGNVRRLEFWSDQTRSTKAFPLPSASPHIRSHVH